MSFGSGEGEYDYIKHQLSQHTGYIKSIVDDTYDMENWYNNIITRKDVKDLILAHTGRGVFRNDSGNMYNNSTMALEALGRAFGYSMKNGYKVLNCNVGIMQADGVNVSTTPALYEHIMDAGWACENLVVGGGTGLMFDDLTRDTNRNAIKPHYNVIDGKKIATMKMPKTDMSKASKGGDLKVDKDFVTHSSLNYSKEDFDKIVDIMIPFYKEGVISTDKFGPIFNRIHAN